MEDNRLNSELIKKLEKEIDNYDKNDLFIEKKENILDSYFKSIEEEIKDRFEEHLKEKEYYPKDYSTFLEELKPKLAKKYEKFVKKTAFMELKLNPQQERFMKEILQIDLMNIEPKYVYSSAVSNLLLFLFVGGILFLTNMLFFGNFYLNIISFLIVIFGFITYYLIIQYPVILAEKRKILSMQQIVKAVLFVVLYMRNNPNLENAIRFAAKYLDPPLSIDFKKIIWDFETKKYKTFKESLDAYLERWKKWDYTFVEAFSLIYNSLMEGNSEKRNQILDKALEIVLSSNFEKMIKYVHNLKNPLTAVYMLGVILPILGLVILAIAGALMNINPIYYFLLYNLFLPMIVYYLSFKILVKRPGLGMNRDIEKYIPELKEESLYYYLFGQKISLKFISLIIFLFLFSFGLFLMIKFNFLNAKTTSDIIFSFIGSLLVVWSFFFSAFFYLYNRYLPFNREINKIEKMEDEFYVTLYQLSIVLDEGLPFEVAIRKVTQISKNEVTKVFFDLVEKELIFGTDLRTAMKKAVKLLPSSLILSSLELILEAVRKSPSTGAIVTKTLSKYLESVKKVIGRLIDLLADIISSIKMQTSFMAPFIAAIVVALQAMTITILGSLKSLLDNMNLAGTNNDIANAGFLTAITTMLENGTPVAIFQLIVGLYIFEITFILTFLYVGIEYGFDKYRERFELAKNYLKVGLTYTILTLLFTLILVLLGKNIVEVSY
ncbi:MAG: hypothetical protein ABGW69_03780 [Nanoarchaeota archaeon]